MVRIKSKHDAFFRRMMKNTRLARDFFQTHLPEKILSLVDLSKIKLEDCSFVDEDLYEHESDVLFSVKRTDTDEDCFLYTLCEHQNTPDPEMPFRLIYYIMQFLKRYLIDHRPSPFPLPLVYPLVVYNGTTPWNTHRDFLSSFGALSEFAQAVFFDPFAILEVAQMDEADLKRAHLCNLMLASMLRTKNIQEIESKVKLLDELFQSCGIDLRSGILRSVLKYLSSCIDPSHQDTQSYWLIVKQTFSPKYQGVVMDLLELTKYQAYQEGKKVWMEKGIEKGIKKTAIQMLKEGVDMALIARVTELPMEEVQNLAAVATE